MSTNKELYAKASKAIEELFNDPSVSKEACIINLEWLKEEIEVLLESMGGKEGE